MVRSPRSTAAEVSSHEVSMARISVSGESGTVSLRWGRVAGSRAAVAGCRPSTSGSAQETAGTDSVEGAGPKVGIVRGGKGAGSGTIVAPVSPHGCPETVEDLPVLR